MKPPLSLTCWEGPDGKSRRAFLASSSCACGGAVSGDLRDRPTGCRSVAAIMQLELFVAIASIGAQNRSCRVDRPRHTSEIVRCAKRQGTTANGVDEESIHCLRNQRGVGGNIDHRPLEFGASVATPARRRASITL